MFGLAVTFEAIGRSDNEVRAPYAASIPGPAATVTASSPARALRNRLDVFLVMVVLPGSSSGSEELRLSVRNRVGRSVDADRDAENGFWGDRWAASLHGGLPRRHLRNEDVALADIDQRISVHRAQPLDDPARRISGTGIGNLLELARIGLADLQHRRNAVGFLARLNRREIIVGRIVIGRIGD